MTRHPRCHHVMANDAVCRRRATGPDGWCDIHHDPRAQARAAAAAAGARYPGTWVAGQWRETSPCECGALMIAGVDHQCPGAPLD